MGEPLAATSGATTEVPLTRQALAREGLALAASLEPADFVGVEVDSVQEPYLIGEVVQPLTVWSGPEEWTFMGRMTEGDQVVQVWRFRGAANVLTPTACTGIPVFAEDIRVAKLLVRPLETRVSSRASAGAARQQKYELESGERAKIVARLPKVGAD